MKKIFSFICISLMFFAVIAQELEEQEQKTSETNGVVTA